jgi:hypothetical protein
MALAGVVWSGTLHGSQPGVALWRACLYADVSAVIAWVWMCTARSATGRCGAGLVGPFHQLQAGAGKQIS